MAKKKKSEDEELNELIAKEQNPEHFEPQAFAPLPGRPEPVEPYHAFPQEEPEARQVEVKDPKHLLPQE